MKPEEQRVAIAKAFFGDNYRVKLIGHPRPEHYRWGDNLVPTPDYLNDLNTMHEAEKVKEMAFDSDYAYWLAHVAVRDRGLNEDKLDVGDGYQIALTATAAQRAEAFLRTIGKWEEGE
jgi:hypothetical protein